MWCSGTLTFTSAGTYNVTLTASDGTLTDTDTFTWTVTNTNRPPAFSTNFGDRTDAEGAVDQLRCRRHRSRRHDAHLLGDQPARRHHHQQLDWSRLGHPVIDQLGHLQRDPDGQRRQPDRDRHLHLDGDRDQQRPVFSTEFGDRTDAEGAAPSFDANATDPDGNTLTYSATNLPAGMTINSSTGVVSGTLAFTAAGSYNVTLTVVRRHADRHRHLHLDGDQHQPATDLQHQLRRSHRRRGHRHQPRCRRHRSRRHGAHLLGHQPARWPHHQQHDRCHQWHAVADQLGHLQRDPDGQRRQPDRDRHLHLDGHRADDGRLRRRHLYPDGQQWLG